MDIITQVEIVVRLILLMYLMEHHGEAVSQQHIDIMGVLMVVEVVVVLLVLLVDLVV